MKYQTGDYITFHTKEQWEQIVEKLERDGQEIWEFGREYDKEDVNVTLMERGYWVFDYGGIEDEYCKRDITDEFFDHLLQEDLCNNPPLEVGDEFMCKSETGKLYNFESLGNNYYRIAWDSGSITSDYTDNEIRDWFKILSYKQANPVQEHYTANKGYEFYEKSFNDLIDTIDELRDPLGFKETADRWNSVCEEAFKQMLKDIEEVCKVNKKRYISLTGDAVPKYYKLVLDEDGLNLIRLLYKYKHFHYNYFGSFCKGDTVIIDMLNKSVSAIALKETSNIDPVVVKIVKDKSSISKQDLEKLHKISCINEGGLELEAANEEEYQKWINHVNNHHKMMLENEKVYRAECFKIIDSLK